MSCMITCTDCLAGASRPGGNLRPLVDAANGLRLGAPANAPRTLCSLSAPGRGKVNEVQRINRGLRRA